LKKGVAMAEGCKWADKSPILQEYHDLEWGHPVVDSLELFEKLCLQCISAGSFKSGENNEFDIDSGQLSVIEARGLYREKFHNFDPNEMVKLTQKDIEQLVDEEKERQQKDSDSSFKGLCKNKQKLKALITNASAYLEMEKNGENFSDFCWSFTKNKMILGGTNLKDIPSYATEMSVELKKKGFSYTTPSVCYAFMQSVGIINDHSIDCPLRNDCIEEANIFGK
jgi:DNA-3-methyladenine glycosylase I